MPSGLCRRRRFLRCKAGKHFPGDTFGDVWRKILLYSEHTWGAYCSVSQSEWAFTKAQWAFKQAFALDGKKDSEKLLDHAVALGADSSKGNGVFVYNTTSWPRTELVVAPKNLAGSADNVCRQQRQAGRIVAALANGDLAILAKEVPPYTSVRFNFTGGQPNPVQSSPSTANGNILDNGLLHVEVDEKTGGISHLTLARNRWRFRQVRRWRAAQPICLPSRQHPRRHPGERTTEDYRG